MQAAVITYRYAFHRSCDAMIGRDHCNEKDKKQIHMLIIFSYCKHS